MYIKMPENAKKIIDTLERAGYEAYIVGGCVRDAVLGKEPDDWDITTSATPMQVKGLFKRTIDTGLQHGTVTVMYGREGYEVTTYRIDGAYLDHRRPDEVTFTTSLAEDLRRRDFTINAMAYSPKSGIIDLYGGMSDIERHIIRAVGNATERFDEDALRILRAIRFSAQLDFDIEEATRDACRAQARYLRDISAERIRVELEKLLLSDHPERLIDAYEIGITAVILPEFDTMMETPQHNPNHKYDVGRHTIEVIRHIEAEPVARLGALLHDCGKPAAKTTDEDGTDHFRNHNIIGMEIAGQVLTRLKYDNDTRKKVVKLVKWHDYGMGSLPSKAKFRKALSEMGADFFPYILKIRKADVAGQSEYRRLEKLSNLQSLGEMYDEIIHDEDCLRIKDLALSGRDLIAMGIKPGEHMGEILDYLLACVLENPSLNDEDTLINIVRDKFAELF